MTTGHKDAGRDAALHRALQACDTDGASSAISIVKSMEDPIDAATAFADLGKALYRDRKDVESMIAVGGAAVKFCLDHANTATSTTIAEKLKKAAQSISYNTAANCWPGWGDEGIRIEPPYLQSALHLANVSRDLVRELAFGRKEEGTACWLLGALKLAAGQPAEALSDFQAAQRSFESGGHATSGLMASGYSALARKADPATAAAGARDLAVVLKQLHEDVSADAGFFAEQLITADKILLAG